MATDMKTHWEHVYETKQETEVSWFQEHARLSLEMIQGTGVPLDGRIVDVGAGASTLVDDLLDHGYTHVSVLDISHAALSVAQQRLGERARMVKWIEGDITEISFPEASFDIWHDRAVFHFLTNAEDRKRYVENVRKAVKHGGHVIVATFAKDGPNKCSGLEVNQYDPESLHQEFGHSFHLVDSRREEHETPWHSKQKFIYCYCRVE